MFYIIAEFDNEVQFAFVSSWLLCGQNLKQLWWCFEPVVYVMFIYVIFFFLYNFLLMSCFRSGGMACKRDFAFK